MPLVARNVSRMKVLAVGASLWHLRVHFASAAHLELQPNVQERFSCEEFDPHIPKGTGWLLDDCLALRESWNRTLNRGDAEARYSHPQFFHEQAEERNRRGFPCQLDTAEVFDGAGSQVLRFLSTWILAEEMGCTVLDSSSRHTSLTDGKLYCHSTVRDPVDNPLGTKPDDVTSHCAVTNWFAYFNLKEVAANEVAVDLAEEPTTNTITVSEWAVIHCRHDSLHRGVARLHAGERNLIEIFGSPYIFGVYGARGGCSLGSLFVYGPQMISTSSPAQPSYFAEDETCDDNR